MRKIAAILLILVLLFNLCGYRLAIALLQNDADRNLETRLDNSDYDESQLVEIRVALNMPYQERFTEFERHYGEIEIDGKSYTYVKRKIEGDVAIFKCIANESKQQLKTITNDLALANSAIDINHSNQPQKQHSSFAKSFWSEYDEQERFQALIPPADAASFYTPYSFNIPTTITDTPHQPPDIT